MSLSRTPKGYGYIIGIAELQYRRLFVDKYKAEGAQFLSIIHCGVYVSESAVICGGSIIGTNANIGPIVRIGKYILINAGCTMGHDS